MSVPSTRDPLGLLDPPLDHALEPADASGAHVQAARFPRWRRAFEWSATSAPVALLLTTGYILGPQGINLVSLAALSSLDPVVPVALAALGVLVGLRGGDRRGDEARVLVAASVASAVTGIVVSAGIAAVAVFEPSALVPLPWALVAVAGICAATSLTLPSGDSLEPRTISTRVIDAGVLLPIVAGGLLLAWMRSASFVEALGLVVQVSAVTVALAAAGWLLLRQASTATDERVFAIAVLLLVGGAADALALSALAGGLVAGVFWRYGSGTPGDTLRRDVLFVQHPLLVLVLLVAGARTEVSALSLTFGAGYLTLRLVGTLSGGLLARRILGPKAPRDLGLYLTPPGVFGVAFALNVVAILGPDASVLVAAVVVGTVGSEFVSLFFLPRSIAE